MSEIVQIVMLVGAICAFGGLGMLFIVNNVK